MASPLRPSPHICGLWLLPHSPGCADPSLRIKDFSKIFRGTPVFDLPLVLQCPAMNTNMMKILRIAGKRAVRRMDTNLLFCSFSSGVAIANAAVCVVGWHPFHFAVALFAAASTLVIASVALLPKRSSAKCKTEQNRTRKRGAGLITPRKSRTCNRQNRTNFRFSQSVRLP